MKLNPQQAPLYGWCVITVQLSDEAADDEGVDYFLLFAGSTQRHLTSTLRTNHDTLHALCPAHDCCEVVSVTLCAVSRHVPGDPEDQKSSSGRVASLAEHRFSFVQDLAFDMAQFLVSTAGRSDGLDRALLLDECQIPLQECERLDDSLALALHHLPLPPGWSLLGRRGSNSTDVSPQETLLHFAARRGLVRVTHFLLQQSGAREALRLANREGHTPAGIAALRGHERLHELLVKAETDAETDGRAEVARPPPPADARLVCHLPRLNTHTLTLRIRPGRDPPTLQRSVEQLLHLIHHLRAQGGSALELQSDHLHTAAECQDGVESGTTREDTFRQPAPQCPDTPKEVSCMETSSLSSDSAVDCGHGEDNGSDCTLSADAPESDLCLQEQGLGPPVDWVFPSPKAEGDCLQRGDRVVEAEKEEDEQEEVGEGEEEEETQQSLGSTQRLSLRKTSEPDPSGAEGESCRVGILLPVGCGKQAEETDGGGVEAVKEGQGATEGEETLPQEAANSATNRKEEEEEDTGLESEVLITPIGDSAEDSAMGQPLSSEGHHSERTEASQEGERVDREGITLSLEAAEGPSVEKGLTECVSTPGDVPSTPLIDGGDVIEGPESAAPCLLIEGLREGEPPPDTNSLEQNQETAVRDYATEQQQGSAPETACHSGNCTQTASAQEPGGKPAAEFCCVVENEHLPYAGEEDGTFDGRSTAFADEEVKAEPLCGVMPSGGSKSTDLDPEMTSTVSSEDDGSFRSIGSSTTDIFHPTRDTVGPEDQEYTEGSTEGCESEEPSGSCVAESNEEVSTASEGFTSEQASVSGSCGTDCKSRWSSCFGTMEALTAEGTGEELDPQQSEESPSPGPQSGGATSHEADETDCTVANDSDSNGESEPQESEVTARVEDCPSVAEEHDKGDLQPNECVEASAENGGNIAAPEQESSQVTADDEELRLVSESDASPPPSSTVENSEPVETAHTSEESSQDPQDVVDGASPGSIQALEDVASKESEVDAEAKETGLGENADFATIHRDREASFHQPCNTLHSEPSASPSLPSRTSSTASCPSRAHRDSGSDTESFLSADTAYDSVFRKNDEPVTGGDSLSEVSVSCSSTDDTASVCPSSSSLEGSQGLECIWSPVEGNRIGATVTAGPDGGGGGGGEAEEEAKDRVSEVPQRSCLLRNSHRSLSPLRRHSWGPGKNNGGDAEMNQRSSIRSPGEGKPTFHRRSYSLEGLTGVQEELRSPLTQGPRALEPSMMPRHDSLDRGSLVSLTEEQEELAENSRMHDLKSRRYRPLRNSCPSMSLPLTKSVSMLAISQRDIDGMRSFSSASGSVAYSISEEEPGPLRTDNEGKGVTKVSRTFSYIKNKMYKKTREKDREKKEKEKDAKEKDKKSNGHLFTAVSAGQAAQCSQCNKTFNNKECFHCSHCNSSVHKSCRDSLPACAKVKMKTPKQQCAVPDSSSSFPAVTMRNKCGGTRERPWSAVLSPEEHSSATLPASRRPTTMMAFHGNNLSKSLSISNIAGPVFEEIPIKGLRYLSQSTDSLNRTNQVTESMESLTDEGTEMMDGQLMGEFEAEAKDLEADSWSLGVEPQYLQQLDKELVKRQDVIYELMQTEMHHIRTLRIMSEVYSKGLQKELQMDVQTVEKLFPALDDLIDFHTQHLLRLFERKRESQLEGGSLDGGFIINRIGDILVAQFSGSNGETMKRIYERFCSRHNEAVNLYKELMTKDKRFKAFIKKKMSSSIVRRLGIPECILLVTQRITKYPVLIQRMLQHTKETVEDFEDLTESIRLLKDVIVAVDSKVNEHEKKRRLKEFHGRMDSKSIMVMKSGQVFARQDLLRRRLIHDGVLQLKSSQGRLKEVHALLLSDVFVFLQEKDQRFVFAMLDQRSTVISLQKLIVREVANEERGLFLITAGIEKPEMMEVLASSKDERNTWMQLIQDAMQSMDRDEDEGIPSETEEDKRQLETKTKEMRDQLRRKDAEIMSLLEEKVQLFRGMWEGLSPAGEEVSRPPESFFRSACSQEQPRGAAIMKDALQEVETLQGLVNGSLGGVMASLQEGGAGAGTVCLPRRAETFGGFDSHQMHSSKSGERDESDDAVGDLRRTESDSVLKKGGSGNFLQLLKRNSEQVLHSVSTLHLLLTTLQAVVIQQDSFMEDQRQALSERSSSCSSLSRQQSSRPSSLIEQEKQRSLEKQRQELASLQRQQAAHAEEKRRREREWELKEQQLSEREGLLRLQEGELRRQQGELEEERQEVQRKKEEYQRDLERLRDAQRRLERDKDAVQRQLDKMEEARVAERTPSTTSDEFQFAGGPRSLELEPLELSSSSSSSSLLSAAQSKLQPQRSKNKGKSLNPFAVSSSSSSTSSNPALKGGEANNQIPKNLLQLAKNKGKEGKEKKKKKGKGGSAHTSDSQHLPEPPLDGEIFFC